MRVAPAFVLFTVASLAATAATGQPANTTPILTPSPTPSRFPGDMDPVAADFQLSLIVWLSTLLLAGICAWAYFASRASDGSAPAAGNGKNGTSKTASAASPVTDKDLESSRISYGFWLIVAGFLITLAVVIVSINHFRPGTGTTADIVAVVTAVTGVIGTLTAAFFGIQAAGAGRSQALSALSEQMRNGSSAQAADYKIDPLAGPHAGNTRISITGNGFTGASAVNFGPTPGITPQVANDGVISVTTPPMPLDRSASTQKGKSDVDVTVVFPGVGTQNKLVGKFYYYTVVPEHGTDGKPYLNIYGSGLAGASQVGFGDAGTLLIQKADDSLLQIPINWSPPPDPAKADAAGTGDTATTPDAAPAETIAQQGVAMPAKMVTEKPDASNAQDVVKDPQNIPEFWNKLWNQELEVAIIFASDVTSTKRTVIGKYRIPDLPKPTPAKDEAKSKSDPKSTVAGTPEA